MMKPNFFILGSPKCGTTSLASWLRLHSQVFVSSPKEPHFFNTDSDHRGIRDIDAYERLFAGAGPEHLAVGEASVWYLVSDNAVANALEYNRDARFIVCARNPVEMAVSLHDQKRFTGDEPLTEFYEAWQAQEDRLSGRVSLPPTCMDVKHLMYGPSCKHGALLQRLYELVPRERVLVLFMDDMKASPGMVYRRTLEFLGVPDDGRMDFPVVNSAKRRKSPIMQQAMRRLWLWKNARGYRFSLGVGRKIQAWNRHERSRDGISDEVTQMLRDYFEDDIRLFGRLTERDLRHWLK
jgi:hypothetical protein